MADDVPCVLFISCSDDNPEELIKLVLNVTELPEKIKINEAINAFPWQIDNKYYTAELKLCALLNKSITNREFADSVEAVVLYFDSSQSYALKTVDIWLPFIAEFDPEIKILVCKNINSEDERAVGLTKREAQEWCINKGFELVELEPTVDDENEEYEDDFQETTGVKRIIQALNAHVWPNLVMKNSLSKSTPLPEFTHKDFNEVNNHQELYHFEQSLEEMLEKDDDFSQLFSQLSEMKARVSNLSGSDRKAAAEQVVKAFWKALNGSDNEFLDI